MRKDTKYPFLFFFAGDKRRKKLTSNSNQTTTTTSTKTTAYTSPKLTQNNVFNENGTTTKWAQLANIRTILPASLFLPLKNNNFVNNAKQSSPETE